MPWFPSIFKTDRIKDLEYNIVDHLEKQETYVVVIKQENFKDFPSGDMVASIEEIEKEDPKQAISKTICVSWYLYKESIDGDVLKVEVFCQSSAVSRLTNVLEKILEADGESRDQLEKKLILKCWSCQQINQGDDKRI